MSIPPSLALKVPLGGVPECCSGVRARREKQCHWYGRREGPPGACHAKAASPPSHVGVPTEHPPSLALTQPLKSGVRGGASGRCAGVLLRRSTTKGKATRVICQAWGAIRCVPCQSRILTIPSPSRVCSSSEHAPSRWRFTRYKIGDASGTMRDCVYVWATLGRDFLCCVLALTFYSGEECFAFEISSSIGHTDSDMKRMYLIQHTTISR